MLQFEKGTDHALFEGEQLAVQQDVVRHGAGGRHHLGKRGGDVVQVARVEDDAVAFLVQLPPDAVVLVLHPCLTTHPTHDRRGVLFRGGEHELQRMHQAQLRRAERPPPGPQCDLADVAGEHAGPGDLRQRHTEPFGDPLFDQARPQPDAQIPGEDLADVLRFTRSQPVEQFVQRLGLLLDGALSVDPDEGLIHVAQ